MIILPEKVQDHKGRVGAKTLNLSKLKGLGLNVPDFVAVPSSVICSLIQDSQSDLENLVKEITAALNCPVYAVRSSALIEDSAKSSYAGQFMTKTNVTREHLGKAILEVIEDAKQKLKGDLSIFSIIVQEYIEADYAGVAFTRNPQHGREMVIEYHQGAGEGIVGGKVLPIRLEFYWNEALEAKDLPGLPKAIKNFQLIEKEFGFPQDIEWCVRAGQFFYLQSRPITSLSGFAQEEFIFLDVILPKNQKYIFEKTEISEIAPRPTPFTLSLLEKIYAQGGPVDKVYKHYGISYKALNFLKVFGNQLYADREQEIKTLLPAYTYLKGNSFSPKFSMGEGLFTSLKNIFRLNLLPLGSLDLAGKVKEKLLTGAQPKNFDQALENFLADYEIIFNINLLAEKAIKRLQMAAQKEGLNIAALLSSGGDVEDLEVKAVQNFQGNSLEVSDLSPFVSRLKLAALQQPSPLAGLSQFKQAYLKPIIGLAQSFNRLREYGRWLTVKNIGLLRHELYLVAQKNKFKSRENIFFFSIGQLQKENLSEGAGQSLRLEYEKYNKFNLPGLLTSSLKKQALAGKLLGVSPGVGEGTLVEAKDMQSAAKTILYTDILSPDLVRHFPYIQGIVSEKGGLLSHLAIMARESGIPVAVNFNLRASGLKLGDKIILDANLGTVKRA